MHWTVILEDETREIIDQLDVEFNPSHINKENNFSLLKYLDPYGDTFFNKLQMPDLIEDLLFLKTIEESEIIDEIVIMAKKCISTPHLILSFYGD